MRINATPGAASLNNQTNSGKRKFIFSPFPPPENSSFLHSTAPTETFEPMFGKIYFTKNKNATAKSCNDRQKGV